MNHLMNNDQHILEQFGRKTGQVAVLIDPEKAQYESQLLELVKKATFAKVNYFFIGGSTVSRQEFQRTAHLIKKHSDIPLVIFPGSNQQISGEADALLYISLLSGRNPDYLIGQHVESAMEVFGLPLELIPTAYLLIDGGTKSSVAYVSQTIPIPRTQNTIAVKTALAGYLQGKKAIFLDAGSGAIEAVPAHFVSEIKEYVPAPIIVGGGITSLEAMKKLKSAGANVLVIGNKIEEEIDFLLDIATFNQKVQ